MLIKAIEPFYERYNFVENHVEMEQFIIKIMTLKLLIDKKYIHLNKADEKKLIQDFTLRKILSLWDKQCLGDDWGNREKKPITPLIWQDIRNFLDTTESLKNVDTAVIGQIYEYCITRSRQKQQGIFYTPKEISDYMAEKGIHMSEEMLLDLACGSGALLNAAYDRLTRLGVSHEKLLKKQIWGIDKDPLAVLVTKLILTLKSSQYCYPEHIYQGDALLKHDFDKLENQFDLILANPPYVGHKAVSAAYMTELKEHYWEVYQNKSDLSYCFFKRGHDFLRENGRLFFITSRYYMEAYHGMALRAYLQNAFEINMIIDFNGLRIIDGVGVDPAMIELRKTQPDDAHQIAVYRFYLADDKQQPALAYLEDLKRQTPMYHQAFKVPQNKLKKDIWRLYTPITEQIIQKIERHAPFTLDNVVESFQGMITGNDKVFVFDNDALDAYTFDPTCLRPWIKNKDIRAYTIFQPTKQLLYTDQIVNLDDYPDEKHYLEVYKEKLSSRRECRNGVRKWYALQWGRNPRLFEQKKIVFPYKAIESRFAIDTSGYYFSADIYGLVLKERLYSQINEEFLVLLLNSRLYDFYFKSFAKKLGTNLYEYYPNTLLRLKIPEIDTQKASQFKALYDKIITSSNQEEKTAVIKTFDTWLYTYFNLSDSEIASVESQK